MCTLTQSEHEGGSNLLHFQRQAEDVADFPILAKQHEVYSQADQDIGGDKHPSPVSYPVTVARRCAIQAVLVLRIIILSLRRRSCGRLSVKRVPNCTSNHK